MYRESVNEYRLTCAKLARENQRYRTEATVHAIESTLYMLKYASLRAWFDLLLIYIAGSIAAIVAYSLTTTTETSPTREVEQREKQPSQSHATLFGLPVHIRVGLKRALSLSPPRSHQRLVPPRYTAHLCLK